MKKKDIIILVVAIILTGLFVYSLFFSTPKYNVTFNTDGGTNIEVQKVKKNATITKPEDPTKDGYKFKEWQVNGNTFNFDTEITKDMELTAIWEKVEPAKDDKTSTTKKKTTKKTTTKKTTTKKTTTTTKK